MMSLSAFLKEKGFLVEVIVDSGEFDFINRINKINPSIIAFNCSTSELNWVLETSKKIKADSDIPVLVGGIHPTIEPDIIQNDNIDIICRGEGEQALAELLERIDQNKDISDIKNLWVKLNNKIVKNSVREPIKNIDSLPFPDRSIYDNIPEIKNSTFAGFVVGRGCPFNCSFCYADYLRKLYKPYSAYVRYKSPDYLIEEIKGVVNKYDIKTIHFYDSIFPMRPEWFNRFLDRYAKEIKIPFTVNLRADTWKEDYLQKLNRCGCTGVAVGLESGNPHIRNDLLRKNINNHSFLNLSKTVHKYNMKLLTFNMVGMPGEKLDDAIETVKLNRKMKTDYALCTFLQPFPNLEITKYAERKNMIDSSESILGYSVPRPLIKTRYRTELIKLNSLFYFLIKLPFTQRMIKLILKLIPIRICNLLGKYNEYCHRKFHSLRIREVKYHFRSAPSIRGSLS